MSASIWSGGSSMTSILCMQIPKMARGAQTGCGLATLLLRRPGGFSRRDMPHTHVATPCHADVLLMAPAPLALTTCSRATKQTLRKTWPSMTREAPIAVQALGSIAFAYSFSFILIEITV